jgi:hypothetical protein
MAEPTQQEEWLVATIFAEQDSQYPDMDSTFQKGLQHYEHQHGTG